MADYESAARARGRHRPRRLPRGRAPSAGARAGPAAVPHRRVRRRGRPEAPARRDAARGQPPSRHGDPLTATRSGTRGCSPTGSTASASSREPMPTRGRGLLREQPGGVPPATASCSSSCRRTCGASSPSRHQRRSSGSPTTSSRPTCSCLDRREDRETLESVMAEEKFHLSYVERELERAQQGENGALRHHGARAGARALRRVPARSAARESGEALEQLLGGGA